MRLVLLCSLLSLSTCYSSHEPAATHDQTAAGINGRSNPAPTSAPDEGLAATARPAPTPPTSPAPPGAASGTGGCQDDSACAEGKVCIHCGQRSSCETGCNPQRPCPEGKHCVQVQCIRCPCPALCQ